MSDKYTGVDVEDQDDTSGNTIYIFTYSESIGFKFSLTRNLLYCK